MKTLFKFVSTKLFVRVLFYVLLAVIATDASAQSRNRSRHRSRTTQSRVSASNGNNQAMNEKGWDFLLRNRGSVYLYVGNTYKYTPPSAKYNADLTKEIGLPGLSIATYQANGSEIVYVVFFKDGRPIEAFTPKVVANMGTDYIRAGLEVGYW